MSEVKVVHNPANKSQIRYEHDCFVIGSKWHDESLDKTVTVTGDGMAGMPECRPDNSDGYTYLANPLSLKRL